MKTKHNKFTNKEYSILFRIISIVLILIFIYTPLCEIAPELNDSNSYKICVEIYWP